MTFSYKYLVLSLSFFTITTGKLFSNQDASQINPYIVPTPYKKAGRKDLKLAIGADYTFWVPYQETSPTATSTAPANKRGATFYPKLGGCSGFKVHGEIDTNHDYMSFNLMYTWFNNPGGSNKLELNPALTYTNFLNQTINTALGISTNFSQRLSRISATLSKGFYGGYFVSFEPWAGLLVPWGVNNLLIIQRIPKDNSLLSPYYNKQSWRGIGPYGGLNSIFYITDEWGFFVRSAAALIISRCNYQTFQTGFTQTSIQSNINQMIPIVENSVGLSWDCLYPNFAFTIKMGWELQVYFNQRAFSRLENNGIFALQGFTGGFSLLF